MRDYLFRGKDVATGKWIYGDLIHRDTRGEDIAIRIYDAVMYPIVVDPETVGQFTEFTDKIDVKIFEDDVIFIPREAGVFKRDVIGLVTYNNGAYWVIGLDNAFGIGLNMLNTKLTQVIGNKHDNQEFFVGKKNG